MLIAFLLVSILFTIEPTDLKKSYPQLFEKHDQTSIDLTNVFNFIGLFSNYVGLMKSNSCVPSLNIRQKRSILKSQSMSIT